MLVLFSLVCCPRAAYRHPSGGVDVGDVCVKWQPSDMCVKLTWADLITQTHKVRDFDGIFEGLVHDLAKQRADEAKGLYRDVLPAGGLMKVDIPAGVGAVGCAKLWDTQHFTCGFTCAYTRMRAYAHARICSCSSHGQPILCCYDFTLNGTTSCNMLRHLRPQMAFATPVFRVNVSSFVDRLDLPRFNDNLESIIWNHYQQVLNKWSGTICKVGTSLHM